MTDKVILLYVRNRKRELLKERGLITLFVIKMSHNGARYSAECMSNNRREE